MNQYIKTHLTPFCGYLAFFTNGMLSVITASIMNIFISSYGFSYNMISICLSLQSLGNLTMVALSGIIIKKVNIFNSITIFCFNFSIGCFGLFFTHNYIIICLSMLITGLGWGLCNNAIHLLINSDQNGSINILHMSYAIGSFAGPFLLSILLSNGLGWQPGIIVIVFLCIAITLFQIITSYYKRKNTNKNISANKHFNNLNNLNNYQNKTIHNVISSMYFLKQHLYIICMLLYFLYIGLELLLNTWLVNYFNTYAAIEITYAQTLLSLFWIAIIVSRLINSFIVKHTKSSTLLIIEGLSSSIITYMITLSNNIIIITILVIMLGLFLGGISPCNALNASNYITGNGTASGILFAFGGLGGIILPLIMGQIVQNYSIKYGMLFIILLMLLFSIIAIFNSHLKKTTNN